MCSGFKWKYNGDMIRWKSILHLHCNNLLVNSWFSALPILKKKSLLIIDEKYFGILIEKIYFPIILEMCYFHILQNLNHFYQMWLKNFKNVKPKCESDFKYVMQWFTIFEKSWTILVSKYMIIFCPAHYIFS